MLVSNLLPYVAGFGSSVCYGIATVLEQIAAKRQTKIDSLRVSHVVKLFKQLPYVSGIGLDIVGWLLFLLAVRQLPLFLGLSFVSLSLVISAIIARIFMNVKSSSSELLAMSTVVVGLILLGMAARPSGASHVNHTFKLIIEVLPIALAVAGIVLLRAKTSKASAFMLSALTGLTFGASGIIARMIHWTGHGLHQLLQVLLIPLLAYAVLGMIFLAAALQRENVNRVNSVVYSSELALPSILGLIFLGDEVRQGLWWLLILGLIMVTVGTVMTALQSKLETKNY